MPTLKSLPHPSLWVCVAEDSYSLRVLVYPLTRLIVWLKWTGRLHAARALELCLQTHRARIPIDIFSMGEVVFIQFLKFFKTNPYFEAGWLMPVILALWEVEAENCLNPGKRMQLAKIASLHSSLATEWDSVSKKKQKVTGQPGPMAHICNPNPFRGQGGHITWGQEFENSLTNMVKGHL